jgi:hypothetical protein
VLRTIVRVRLLPRLALALVLATLTVPVAGALGGAREVQAAEDPIDVGTQLMATTDVTLHQAEICKGSKVSVTQLRKNAGRLEGVSVALADGHVVKVTMAQVHTFFRVVND